jgi:hypothetical protein
MSSPSYPPWFNHPNNIRRRIQVMKLIIMQSKININGKIIELFEK